MEITIVNLLSADAVLGKLRQEKGLPVRDAYRIARLAMRLAPEIAAAVENRNKLIMQFGIGPDSNGAYRIPQEIDGAPNPNWAEYVAAAIELIKSDAEIDATIIPLPLSVFEKATSLTPADLIVLAQFIQEEETK